MDATELLSDAPEQLKRASPHTFATEATCETKIAGKAGSCTILVSTSWAHTQPGNNSNRGHVGSFENVFWVLIYFICLISISLANLSPLELSCSIPKQQGKYKE